MFSGFFDLPWWGYVVVALVMTHITIVSVTVFLHRHQAHRSLDLHPVVSHFFRAWLWFTTGMITKEWTAVHRKHHATCETEEDPHSPQIVGLPKVLFGGVELYRRETVNEETLKTFGRGTPDDWIENNVYSRYRWTGVFLMALIDIFLFGLIPGALIYITQMLWIPFWAAGVINGVGHYFGYRNFSTKDESRNIVPWGILIGGEELHNNHHAYASSARLSNKWYEFDIGWFYIRLMEMLGLAKVHKVAPKVHFDWNKTRCDLETLKAIVLHRLLVMDNYRKTLKVAYSNEVKRLKESAASRRDDLSALKSIKGWIFSDMIELKEDEKVLLKNVLSKHKVLETLYNMRKSLRSLWEGASGTQDQLVQQLEEWCCRAEASGIAALESFSKRLRCYALA